MGKVLAYLVALNRIKLGITKKLSYGIIDSQSVKTTTCAEQRGINGGEKIKGRKYYIVVDAQGHLLHIRVHKANKNDSKVACSVVERCVQKYPSLKGFSADAGYRGMASTFIAQKLEKSIEGATKTVTGWTILTKKWAVKRTFAWGKGHRRLAKGFKTSISAAENFFKVAHCAALMRKFKIV